MKQEIANSDPTNDKDLTLAARSALLDFYGDRSVSFASFFLASVFGLVTTSAIVQQLKDGNLIALSSVLYWAFSYVGHYSYKRFSFYSEESEKIRSLIEKSAELGEMPDKLADSQNRLFMKGLTRLGWTLKHEDGQAGIRIQLFDFSYLVLILVLGLLVYPFVPTVIFIISVFLLFLYDWTRDIKFKYYRELLLIFSLVLFILAWIEYILRFIS